MSVGIQERRTGGRAGALGGAARRSAAERGRSDGAAREAGPDGALWPAGGARRLTGTRCASRTQSGLVRIDVRARKARCVGPRRACPRPTGDTRNAAVGAAAAARLSDTTKARIDVGPLLQSVSDTHCPERNCAQSQQSQLRAESCLCLRLRLRTRCGPLLVGKAAGCRRVSPPLLRAPSIRGCGFFATDISCFATESRLTSRSTALAEHAERAHTVSTAESCHVTVPASCSSK